MKNSYIKVLFFITISTLLLGCAASRVRPTISLFSPSKLQKDQFQPKVDNFVVILDTSSSMSEKYRGYSKFKIAVDYLSAMNQTIPELNYNSALVTFSSIFEIPERSTFLAYGPTKYSTAGLESALNGVKLFAENSSHPPVKAISVTEKELISTQGKTAIIIVSDGVDMNQMTLKAVYDLKDKMGDRVCIYPIRIGDDSAGKKYMESISAIGACGFPVMVVDHKTSMTMGDLVEMIFLTKAQKPATRSVKVVNQMDSDGDGVTDDKDQCPNTPVGATVDARGCWTYAASVLFDFDSVDIKPGAYSMLNEAYDILKKNQEIVLELDGHTDNIGSEEYNMKLSENRANAVMEYFVGKGIDPNRFIAKGFGFTKPAASNDTKEGRAQNRRVELTPFK